MQPPTACTCTCNLLACRHATVQRKQRCVRPCATAATGASRTQHCRRSSSSGGLSRAPPRACAAQVLRRVPASLAEVDNGTILGFGADLAPDHPVRAVAGWTCCAVGACVHVVRARPHIAPPPAGVWGHGVHGAPRRDCRHRAPAQSVSVWCRPPARALQLPPCVPRALAALPCFQGRAHPAHQLHAGRGGSVGHCARQAQGPVPPARMRRVQRRLCHVWLQARRPRRA